MDEQCHLLQLIRDRIHTWNKPLISSVSSTATGFSVLNLEVITNMHSIDLFSSTCYKQKARGSTYGSYGPKNHPINVLRYKFPTKVPVILERYRYERDLPDVGQRKYVIPQEMSMSQFHQMVRQRMNLSPSKALFFLVNNRTMVSLGKSLLEVYDEFQDADGFLYITYASQDVFG